MLWTWPKSTEPPPAGMRPIPCTGFDLAALDLILTTGLIIDARLDARKLEETLTTLIEPKFPRAGARIALRNGVAVFDDLTFLGVTASHVGFDALGTWTLLDAWTRLINGQHVDEIVGMAWDAQPFASLATTPTKVAGQRGWFDLGLWSQILFIAYFMWRLFRDPKESARLVRVPKAFLADAKRGIMDDLKREGSTEWVGSSDVLTAWWLTTAMGHRTTSTTPFHLHIPVNLRAKPVLFPPGNDAPYIHNAVSAIPVPRSPSAPSTPTPTPTPNPNSLAEIALHIRHALRAHSADTEGMRADAHWRCAHPRRVLYPCGAGGEWGFQSSWRWRAAGWGGVGFSGAAVRRDVDENKKKEEKKNAKARVIFVLPLVSSGKRVPLRGCSWRRTGMGRGGRCG